MCNKQKSPNVNAMRVVVERITITLYSTVLFFKDTTVNVYLRLTILWDGFFLEKKFCKSTIEIQFGNKIGWHSVQSFK